MSYLSFQSCVTHFGSSPGDLYRGLLAQNPHLFAEKETDCDFFSSPLHKEEETYLRRSQKILRGFFEELKNLNDCNDQKRWSLVLASTKGVIEDMIWKQEVPVQDPYQALLDWVETQFPYPLLRKVAVSNACASSHGAIALAQDWLKRDISDHVCVLAIDLIGPFVLKGFQSLRALSEKRKVCSFDKARDGLLLGDGAGCLVLSKNNEFNSSLRIGPVHSLCEASAATRPDTSGKNLALCFENCLETDPSLLIAHGTGTVYNDLTESNAIELAFAKKVPPPVTCSKWGIGHTLGTSGLIDICLASEILRHQTVPGIATLKESDLAIRELLVYQNQKASIDSVLISSLGFGGMCSALQLHGSPP